MLERVKQQPQKNTTGDILDNAISWKIPIYPLNKFLGWIERVSNRTEKLFKDQNTSANSPPVGRSVKVLTGSYLKIETGSRPEFKLFSNWPSLGLSAPVHRSVTSATAHQTQEKVEPRNVNTNKKDLNSNEPSHRMTRKVGRTAAKEASSAVGGGNGYCEICRVYYDQLDSHTVSAQHLKLVTDSAQYSQLDSIIQQNNLGSNSLRKSLRIAKSPPPFLPPEMGGKQSSGSSIASPGALETPPKDLTRGLRLKECSVSLGPPSPLINGFTSLKSPRSVTKHLASTAAASPVPPLHIVMNGCGRRSQRTHQPLNDILPDKEVNDVLPATPVKDRNLRSRKANSAQTPITPPPPERLPSPPPEKLSPPHLRSGSEKAMARSDRSLRGSEDRALTVRCSVEKERTWVGGCKSSDKEKSQSMRSSYTPVEATGMTTRSFRERSVDVEVPAKTSPPKSLEKPEKRVRHHERARRGRDDKDDRSEDDESHKRKRKEPTPEEDFREERRRRREERTSCALRVEDEDKEKTQSHSSSRDRLSTSTIGQPNLRGASESKSDHTTKSLNLKNPLLCFLLDQGDRPRRPTRRNVSPPSHD
uniref:DBF4-type domain-containing protein n=1 Tax=Lygus hesperus TaxID=30085 RepID=A0A0K8SWP1_LYGHE